MVAVLGFAAAVSAAVSPVVGESGSNLIVPGRGIGQTRLGGDGARSLGKLPKPDVVDAGMSQTRQVWVSKKGGRTDTLFVHTVSNGALGVLPAQGVTIDLIRVTSPWFRTRDGLSTGSTLAEIRRRFPRARPMGPGRTLYDDAKNGIAFEFTRGATDASPCVAIMVHPPGKVRVASAEDVSRLLREGKKP